jgi:hypothetical protein
MKPTLALWMLPVFVPAATAADITCNAGVTSIPVFNPSSTSGAVGDYTLDCTGGTPGTTPMNFTSFMNVAVLNTGGWTLTDGVNNFAGTLVPSNVVEFLSVPVNPPGLGHLNFKVEGIFVNPSMLPPGAEFREDMTIFSPVFSITIVNSVQTVAVNAAPELGTLPLTSMALGVIIWLGRRASCGLLGPDAGDCSLTLPHPSDDQRHQRTLTSLGRQG